MAVTYRFLSLQHRATLARTKAFQYEYEHFIADEAAKADPADTKSVEEAAILEKRVAQAQADFDALVAEIAVTVPREEVLAELVADVEAVK